MVRIDPAVRAHLEWIGFIQPTGLVVSAPALVRAGAILDQRDTEGQRLLGDCVVEHVFDPQEGPVPFVPDFCAFARTVLDWNLSPKGYAGVDGCSVPDELEVPLPGYGETLRPDLAVRELDTTDDTSAWQLLVRLLQPGEDFDREVSGNGRLEASAHGRMERLLRETHVSAGLLFNGRMLRLVSAPRGESSGWADFQVADMLQTSGRPISSALRLLLSQRRLLSLAPHQRFAALLADSRKYQNEVSERLSEQVLHALYELLRGFQAAHDASDEELLHEPLSEQPDEAYRAMLAVILRLVFLLYAEERAMLPGDETFQRSYSIAGLFERLREDSALHPDTMDQRYGAWAQLLVLFRMLHDGATYEDMRLPPRHGALFDPERFPFLEGRRMAGVRQTDERIEVPLVPDGTIYRVLEDLLVLDGERISYRALDVEQIGSVYETMMGFRLETATGRSVAIRPKKKRGAPAMANLEEALAQPPAKRARWIADRADRKLTANMSSTVAAAASLEDLHAALEKMVDQAATPDLVAKGAMVLQPSEERRRSGSHYTPRALTEPIVRITLEPILARLSGPDGSSPTPAQILDLKVCDPAMGSGAFLVEACRQLGDALVEAWRIHGETPDFSPDEDEIIYARRLVSQRCLYGIDRNPVAVDLAKMSLWLVTLARDHPLTFVDHALRHGDSLIGLTRRQIEAFHWVDDAPVFEPGLETVRVGEHIKRVAELRARIRSAGENVSDSELRDLWDDASNELGKVYLLGNLALAAFFEGDKPKAREAKRVSYAQSVASGEADQYRAWLEDWRHADSPLAPFHWELEFPEVFDRANPGFDAIVGNPPFMGGSKISTTLGPPYLDWLRHVHKETHGNGDMVAHFFRRAFNLVRRGGAFGLIATNTIAQGDTRATGLGWICINGGEIYRATKRYRWPGVAAVVVSVLHVIKGRYGKRKILNGREVDVITAFLFHQGGHNDPSRLQTNAGLSFIGHKLTGQGFTFDDTNTTGMATPLAEMRRLITKNPSNRNVIFPYIGGEEVNTSPTHAHHRYAINFGNMSEDECRRRWPDLMAILQEKVRPERSTSRLRSSPWWMFERTRPELQAAIEGLDRVLAISRIGQHAAFAFVPSRIVYSDSLIIFPSPSYSVFCGLQSRGHETWARFFGSSMKDDLRYTSSDCFETFPFPEGWETHALLETAGKEYCEFRADLMIKSDEGLTKTYNRFHDPNQRDPEIEKLRHLHADMDRAALDAYGWTDISTDCDYFLDYEIDEEWGTKKKPWRYRWPDEVRDDVLARLLALNAKRAGAEARSGAVASKSARQGRSP